MRIGIDASRATVARRTGTEDYALNLIRALIALDSGHELTLYFRDRPAPGLFPDHPRLTLRAIPFPRLWTHLRLSWEMMRHPPEVLFVPAHVLPLCALPATVVTVHDLGYRHYPDAHPLAQRLYLDWSTRFSVQRATRVIADSEATRQDLIRFYRLSPDRITVVYPGRDESLRPVRDPVILDRLRQKYGLSEPYLLHVGTLQPRKNLVRLVEAFGLLVETFGQGREARSETGPGPEVGDGPGARRVTNARGQTGGRLTLALAGRRGWLARPILEQIRALGLQDRVRLLDYVADEDLPALYSAARLYLFPSLYEGFGFTPLEAMACGTPVVCARASSLPEVVGDAARLVDPHDVPALAAAIADLLAHPDHRADLVQRGFRQVGKFSWARCAEETLAVLRAASATA